MPRPQRIRATPRISVNKLGEFLTTSSPTRRRRIVREQKLPSEVVVLHYSKAWEPIAKYLKNGCTDPAPIADAITKIRNATPTSDWVASDNANTITALQHFLEAAKLLPEATYIKGQNEAPPLVISGVEVSVRPDFILRMTKREKTCTGTLKIHYTKDDDKALSKSGQEYVATLCHLWATKHGPKSYAPDPSLCFSLDLFRRHLVEAPKSVTRRMAEIEIACSEIAAVWPIA
jgi:hypothetical protein